ncbi:MAG: DUF2125 domain-containing protein, partial [Stellaceae bacterium]
MRRVVVWVGGLAVLLAAAYTGYWYYLVGVIQKEMVPWTEARRAQGLDIKWQDVKIGGFPLAVRLHFHGFGVAAVKPMPYQMEAADIAFWSAPWDLRHWHFNAPDGARIEMILQSAGFDAKTLDGTVSVPLQPGGSADIAATGLTGRGVAQGLGVDSAHLALSQPDTPPR